MRILLFIAAFLMLSAPVAEAQTRVAVVDVKRILMHSDAAVSIKKQQSALREKFLAEISKTEQSLRGREQELLKLQETLAPDIYAKKKREYEGKMLEAGRLTRERKRALDTSFKQAMDQLSDRLNDIVREVADEKGYDLVISNQNVITGAASLDITDLVLERFNKHVADINLEQSVTE